MTIRENDVAQKFPTLFIHMYLLNTKIDVLPKLRKICNKHTSNEPFLLSHYIRSM